MLPLILIYTQETFNNPKSTIETLEICSKLTIKEPLKLFWCVYGSLWALITHFLYVPIAAFEQVSRSVDWFLLDRDLCHQRVKYMNTTINGVLTIFLRGVIAVPFLRCKYLQYSANTAICVSICNNNRYQNHCVSSYFVIGF